MFGRGLIWVVLLLNVFALCSGADEAIKPDDEEVQTNIIPQSSGGYTSDLFRPGMGLVLAQGGVMAAMILGVVLVGGLIAQAFGIKLCTIMGNCQDNAAYQAYSANPSGYTDYQGYQQGTYNNPVYQKRSLEYVGPILKMLGNAYEKYSRSLATDSKTA